MPLAVLDCEICGRKGSVIPCVNAQWCQHGRCLKCHTSILGQKKFYAKVNDSILTCESCVAYGEGCVVTDGDIEALRTPNVIAVPAKRNMDCNPTDDQHKRVCVMDHHEASRSEHQPPAVPKAADPKIKLRPLPAAPSGKCQTSSASKQQFLDPRADHTEQDKPSAKTTVVKQDKPPAKTTGVKRSNNKAADQPSSKRPATHTVVASATSAQPQQPIGHAQLANEQPQPRSTKGRSQHSAMTDALVVAKAVVPTPTQHTSTAADVVTDSSRDLAAAMPVRHDASSGKKSALYTSKHVGSKGSLADPRGSQQGADPGDRLQGHEARSQHDHKSFKASSSSQKKGAIAAGRPQLEQTTSASAHAAALLAGKGVSARALQVKADSSSINTTSNGRDSEQQRAVQHKQGPTVGGVIAASPNALLRRADERKKSLGLDHKPTTQAPPRKVLASSTQVANIASNQTTTPHATYQPFKLQNAISAVQVGQACSDDGEHDSDQDMRTGRQQACPDLPIQASHDVRSRKIVVPQNTNDWTGRASIAADDVLDIDVRVVPFVGVAMPPLLQLLKAQQATEVDGSLITRAVMDKVALKECRQSSSANLSTNFSKLLVVLKERAFGQDKQLHTLIRQMIDQKKYLRLTREGQSMYFSPVLRGQIGVAVNMELVDYSVVVFNKHEDVFEQVHDDQLGVVYHLTQGEELPISRCVQFVHDAVGGGGEASGGGSGWNKNQVAPKSNLKKDASSELPQHVRFGETKILTSQHVTVSEVAFVGDDDDWLEAGGGGGVFASGHGGAAREGSLGAGMGPHGGVALGFMAVEDVQDAHLVRPKQPQGALVSKPWEKLDQVPAPGVVVGRSGAHHSAASSQQVSPETCEPPPAQAVVPSSTSHHVGSSHGIISNVLLRDVQPNKLLVQLMPGLQGLCDYLKKRQLSGVRVHLDDSLLDDNPDQAETLRIWAQDKGAAVTTRPHVPRPANINLLVVSHHHVTRYGMEGSSSGLSIKEFLVEGVHVVSELFMDGLCKSNFALRAEAIERDKAKQHWQFFASGVILLLDESLLANAPISQLKLMIGALKAAAKHMGTGHGFYKAFIRGSAREKHQLSNQHMGPLLKSWRDEGILVDLPLDYTSSTPKPGMPEIVRDASKAFFVINNKKGPLRYMVIVVPDDSDQMDAEAKAHVDSVINTTACQKTIFAATLSEIIRFLNVFADARE